MCIDTIPNDDIPIENKKDFIKKYQQLVGGFNWVSLCTRPKVTVATRLLARRMKNPSQGQYDAALHVLKWLGTHKEWGIRFVEGGDFAKGICSWVDKPVGLTEATGYPDANWGPQDASTTKLGNEIDPENCHSLLGHIIVRMGNAIHWDCYKEPKTSHSVCQAKILSVDKLCKSGSQIQNVSQDLDLDKASRPM